MKLGLLLPPPSPQGKLGDRPRHRPLGHCPARPLRNRRDIVADDLHPPVFVRRERGHVEAEADRPVGQRPAVENRPQMIAPVLDEHAVIEIDPALLAYRRLVWRRAQLALESPAIWGAVETLAMVLNELYWPDSEEVGEHECTMPGATARAIIRRAGVHPGIELPKKLP